MNRPALLRNEAGYLVGADGKVLTNRRGEPLREAERNPKGGYRDRRVVETGEREPSPKGVALHRVFAAPGELVRFAWPVGAPWSVRKNQGRSEGQVVDAVRWLAGECDLSGRRIKAPGVRIVRLGRRTKTGNPEGFPWRVVPPRLL